MWQSFELFHNWLWIINEIAHTRHKGILSCVFNTVKAIPRCIEMSGRGVTGLYFHLNTNVYLVIVSRCRVQDTTHADLNGCQTQFMPYLWNNLFDYIAFRWISDDSKTTMVHATHRVFKKYFSQVEEDPWWYKSQLVHSFWNCDAIWRNRSGSTLTQVMTSCMVGPYH